MALETVALLCVLCFGLGLALGGLLVIKTVPE
jgi:hypothetical protein